MPRPDLLVPLLTPELPGCGGRIKVRPEDFVVDEIPAYEPIGQGEHLYLRVEKAGVGAEHFAQTIARRLGKHVGAVGLAGIKDRHAITRQWVSVPVDCEPKLGKLDGDGIRVLDVKRHGNKLKPGHLKGNRFSILVRDADRTMADSVAKIVKVIVAHGLPNYYGPQRFGRGGETADLGFECLSGRSRKRLRPFLFKFAISAAQSVLFNRVLAERHRDGLLRTVLPGDVMMKRDTGGLFTADDVPAEQARFDAGETVPAGPMFGSRTFAAKGIVAEREDRVLRESGLSPESFGRFGKLAGGTRRANLLFLDDLKSEWTADGLRLVFSMTSGSYATVVLREIMKVDLAEPGRDEDDDDE